MTGFKIGISLCYPLALGSAEGYIVPMCFEWDILRLTFDFVYVGGAPHIFWEIPFDHVTCNLYMDNQNGEHGKWKYSLLWILWIACLMEFNGVEMWGSYYCKNLLFILN